MWLLKLFKLKSLKKLEEGGIVPFNEYLKSLDSRVALLQAAQRKTEQAMVPVITCKDCGCLVYAVNAVKGKSEIRERSISGLWPLGVTPKEDYIYTPFYCKRCAPKEKKAKAQ